MKLTPFAKLFIALVIVGVGAVMYLTPSVRNRLLPEAPHHAAAVPPRVDIAAEAGTVAQPAVVAQAGCAGKPEVVIYLPAWNGLMGLIRANGGPQSTRDSLMCGTYGLNVRLVKDDDTTNAYGYVASFAEEFAKGNPHPTKGAPIFFAMGDGGPMHVTQTNKRLSKVGGHSRIVIAGAVGFSDGEDAVMGPKSWVEDPQRARGSYLAVVPGDGDHILLNNFAAAYGIPVNLDFKVFDPQAINIAPAKDYLVAAQMYISNYCENLRTKSGSTERHCVDSVSTWTPGDVNVAKKRGGLVRIVSTHEFPYQMPATLFAYGPWAEANPEVVASILAASFQAADLINDSDDERHAAAAMSAAVYGEHDAAYWYRYSKGTTETDKTGMPVQLGGSSVSNYATIDRVFGGTTYRTAYTAFGKMLQQQLPDMLPSFDPVEQALDTRYLKLAGEMLRKKGLAQRDDTPVFNRSAKVSRVVGKRSWDIQFATGKADFLPSAYAQLEEIRTEALVAGTSSVLIDGHTDDRGNADTNVRLSTARARKVADYLKAKSPEQFPDSRLRVQGHGMSQPVASNDTEDGRRKNRRVEITLGISE